MSLFRDYYIVFLDERVWNGLCRQVIFTHKLSFTQVGLYLPKTWDQCHDIDCAALFHVVVVLLFLTLLCCSFLESNGFSLIYLRLQNVDSFVFVIWLVFHCVTCRLPSCIQQPTYTELTPSVPFFCETVANSFQALQVSFESPVCLLSINDTACVVHAKISCVVSVQCVDILKRKHKWVITWAKGP